MDTKIGPLPDMKAWKSAVLQSPNRLALPIMTHPGIEHLGYTVLEAVQQAAVQAEAMIWLNERYDTVAATAMMDLTVEAEAFGCAIEFQPHDMPHIKGRLLDGPSAVEALSLPPLTAGRLPVYLEANDRAVKALSPKPVFGGMIGPFSLAGRLYDLSELMMACYMEPDTVHRLLDRCTSFLLTYARAMKEQGCGGVVMAEPAAGLLSNDDCQTFSSAYVRRIVEALQDDHFLVVLHNCGNTGQCTEAMLATGAGAYHFGNAIDMAATLALCPTDVLVMGNLDPVGIFKQGSPASIKASTQALLEQTRAFPHFVVSSGCDLPPMVPQANLEAFFECLNTYNRDKNVEEHI